MSGDTSASQRRSQLVEMCGKSPGRAAGALALLTALAALAVAVVSHIAIEIGGDRVSSRAEAVIVNDTEHEVAVLGAWKLGGEWSAVSPRNVAWKAVVRIKPGQSTHLTFEREGADSVRVIVRTERSYGILTLYPKVLDTLNVSAVRADPSVEDLSYYERFRLWLPLVLAALAACLAAVGLRLTRSRDVMSRLAILVAVVVVAFAGILLLDVSLF